MTEQEMAVKSSRDIWKGYDKNGKEVVFTSKPSGGSQVSGVTHYTRVIYENGEVYDFDDNNVSAYIKTDPQVASAYWKGQSSGDEGALNYWTDDQGNRHVYNPDTGIDSIISYAPSGVDNNRYVNVSQQPTPTDIAMGIDTPSSGKKRIVDTKMVGNTEYVMPEGGTDWVQGRTFNSESNALDDELKRAQIAKYNQDLQGTNMTALQQQNQAIAYVEQQIAAGKMTPEQGNAYIEQVKRSTNATIQGTTPYQQQTDQQNFARGVLGDQATLAQSIASGLMGQANDAFSNILGGSVSNQAVYNFDPYREAENYITKVYGAKARPMAQSIIEGALSGNQRAQQQVTAAAQKNVALTSGNVDTSGVEQYRPIVQQYFPPDQVDNALKIMALESGGNAQARNLSDIEDSNGLMQVNVRAHPQYTTQQMQDPTQNIQAAANIYNSAGNWSPWYNAAKKAGLLD